LHALFPEALTSDEISKLPGYNPATKQQDIANAVKLMDAAGYHDGVGVSFKDIISGNPGVASFDTAVRQKEQWAKIWPKMDMRLQGVPDYGSFTNLLNSREFEARTYNHTMVPDAAIDARTYYHSKGGRNYQSYERPWVDEALDKMFAAQSAAEKKEIIRPFQLRYIAEGPPLLQLRIPPDSFVVQGNFGGMDMVTGPWTYQSYGVSPRWVWQTVA
jgi:ABC-type transport system substrate-binding protein